MANEVDIKFSADISDLQKGMQQASAAIDVANRAMRNGAAQMASSFGALSAAYASSAAQKVRVAKDGGDDALAFTRPSGKCAIKLAIPLGSSVERASSFLRSMR